LDVLTGRKGAAVSTHLAAVSVWYYVCAAWDSVRNYTLLAAVERLLRLLTAAAATRRH
jgi:hypothetical protein